MSRCSTMASSSSVTNDSDWHHVAPLRDGQGEDEPAAGADLVVDPPRHVGLWHPNATEFDGRGRRTQPGRHGEGWSVRGRP